MSSHPSSFDDANARPSDDDGFAANVQENTELLAYVGAGFLALAFLAAVIVRGSF